MKRSLLIVVIASLFLSFFQIMAGETYKQGQKIPFTKTVKGKEASIVVTVLHIYGNEVELGFHENLEGNDTGGGHATMRVPINEYYDFGGDTSDGDYWIIIRIEVEDIDPRDRTFKGIIKKIR